MARERQSRAWLVKDGVAVEGYPPLSAAIGMMICLGTGGGVWSTTPLGSGRDT